MCIITRSADYDKPYNSSKVRWKVLRVQTEKKPELRSIHMGATKWNIGTEKRAVSARSLAQPQDIGFHVFLTKTAAIESTKKYNDGIEYYGQIVVVRLEVDRFNHSGTWRQGDGYVKNETWRRARLTNVFTASGRHDITNRFKR